ncbi:hypothetical protein W97_03779 [Coniosporium apollinis CBS 100218]|uniref:Nuclear distribution protein RO10 n=1 Tax=Coniosporium apollinis (strain CBS 100218) TaxID=1168221 RepID=R7YSC1_CONA1|nr:uncharacterized protein W97_03779 [Coniosporium apollinis CBS 100218]EON64546.1 hypothetical protein W97_03779 [Coniosporium apollinis CBS 100218]
MDKIEEGCDIVVLQTLRLLEERMRRLEFVLDGDIKDEQQQQTQDPVVKRLQKLEESLHKLTSGSSVIADVVLVQSRHADLLNPPEPLEAPEAQPGLEAPHKLATVLAEAPLYPATASQLTSLNDIPIPPTESFASLIALHPRIAAVARRQNQHARQIAFLSKKSAQLVLKWQKIFIIGQGRCWVEWDNRLRKAAREVGRVEVRRGGEGEL